MNKDRCRELLKIALEQRAFPPRLQMPEARGDVIAPLFESPYIVWVPEVQRPGRRPKCVDAKCLCVPSVKEYMWRQVDDVDHVTYFLYIKYCCTGEGDNRPVFSTKGDRYLSQASDSVQLQLPYILQEKGGKSLPLFRQIHDGVMSSDGLERVRTSVERSRLARYYYLRSLFAARVEEKRRHGEIQLAPTPPSVHTFMEANPVPCHQALTQFWLAQTKVLSLLASSVMRSLEIKRVLRIDHSRKLAKKLRKYTATTRQDQKEMHLLLLVQNEAGQIVARALTRSENNDETEKVLVEEIKDRIHAPQLGEDVDPVYLVSDNANAIRGMVNSVFGTAVSVRQDPFHVFQRLSENIKDRATRKVFSKALREALYDGDEELKAPAVAATEVEAVCAKFVPPESARSVLKSTVSEWEGSVRSNIAQIRGGDLYVPVNVYREGGGFSKVVSTSQLESVHAQLKRLINRAVSYEVGLRVLDLFLLEHNLRAGAKFGRNPNLGSLDLLSLCRAAVRCNNVLPESPELEFALSKCAAKLRAEKYHYKSKHDFPFSSFDALFRSVQPDTAAIEARLHPEREYRQDIRRFLLNQKGGDRVTQSLFGESLRSLTIETEDAAPLSSHEYELLRQVRSDQRAYGNSLWAQCSFTSTILYNIAASRGPTRFRLRQRSKETLEKHIDHIDARIASTTDKVGAPIFSFQRKKIDDGADNEHESLVQADLFALLRSMESKRKVIDLFHRLYDVAAALLDPVRPKSEKHIRKRWEALRKTEMRSSIKLRFPASLFQMDDQVEASEPNDSISTTARVATGPVNQSDAVSTNTSPQNEGSQWSQQYSVSCDSLVPDDESVLVCSAATLNRADPSGQEPTTNENEMPPLALPTEFISKEDLKEIYRMSEIIGPKVRGKWPAIADWYRKRRPDSSLTVDAIYSRVKRYKQQVEDASSLCAEMSALNTMINLPSPSPSPPLQKKTACRSCKQKHRSCGLDSKNPTREIRLAKKPSQASVAQFFSSGSFSV